MRTLVIHQKGQAKHPNNPVTLVKVLEGAACWGTGRMEGGMEGKCLLCWD